MRCDGGRRRVAVRYKAGVARGSAPAPRGHLSWPIQDKKAYRAFTIDLHKHSSACTNSQQAPSPFCPAHRHRPDLTAMHFVPLTSMASHAQVVLLRVLFCACSNAHPPADIYIHPSPSPRTTFHERPRIQASARTLLTLLRSPQC